MAVEKAYWVRAEEDRESQGDGSGLVPQEGAGALALGGVAAVGQELAVFASAGGEAYQGAGRAEG